MTNLIPLTEDAAAVIVPEGRQHYLGIDRVSDESFLSYEYMTENALLTFIQILPPGQWEIVSRASAMTEEQWGSIVERIVFRTEAPYRTAGFLDRFVYKHYINTLSSDPSKCFCDTRTESGHSLLASKGIYLKNELGEKPQEPEYTTRMSREENLFIGEEYRSKLELWSAAQSKVSDPIIIRKIK